LLVYGIEIWRSAVHHIFIKRTIGTKTVQQDEVPEIRASLLIIIRAYWVGLVGQGNFELELSI